MKVLKKQKDILAQYQKEVGKEVAQKQLRSEQAEQNDQEQDDQFNQIKLGYIDTEFEQFKDQLPLKNDPYRYSIKAMQSFVKPLQLEIAQQLRNTKQSQIRAQRIKKLSDGDGVDGGEGGQNGNKADQKVKVEQNTGYDQVDS